jgi:hypothetical protein
LEEEFEFEYDIKQKILRQQKKYKIEMKISRQRQLKSVEQVKDVRKVLGGALSQ